MHDLCKWKTFYYISLKYPLKIRVLKYKTENFDKELEYNVESIRKYL